MKKEKELFRAITEVSDELVEEAGKRAVSTQETGMEEENTEAGDSGEVNKKAGKSVSKYRGGKRYIAAAACVALMTGLVVTAVRGSGGNAASADALMKVEFPKAYEFEDYDTAREFWQANEVSEEFYEALEEFGWETSSALLSGESGNRNYSPLSLYYALAMAAAGAKGETQEELLELLGMENCEELLQECGRYYRRCYKENEVGKLKLANSIWLDDELAWKKDYVTALAENLYTEAFQMDFADAATGERMSTWVAENTDSLLSPQLTTDPEMILSIMNTVCYEDEWIDRFQEKRTAEAEFYLADGTTVNCDFMNQTLLGGFYKGDGFIVAGRSLKNAGRMLFVLPDEGVTPDEILASPEKLKEAFASDTNCYGDIIWQVPKLKISSRFDLKEMLKELGVSSAFEEDADFSGITDDIAFISDVHQETCIELDEKGVSATAFTQINYAGAALPEDTAYMILNRPFLYAILINEEPLFIGVCENPTEQ